MDAVEALTQLGGVADSALIAALSSRKRLRSAVRRGDVVRLTRDRFALPLTDVASEAALAVNGYLTHLSAAANWGWEIAVPPQVPQIALPRRRPVPLTRVPMELFRLDLVREDLDGVALNRLQTAVACLADLPLRDALGAVDSAVRHGDLDVARVAAATAGLTGERGVRAGRAAAHVDGRAANPFESALRAIAIESGLAVIPQYAVTVEGITYHPDLANPLLGIALEADSWGWHADKQAHDRDCARYNALAVAGWLVLRFTWPQVMFSPSFVRRTIQAAMSTVGGQSA